VLGQYADKLVGHRVKHSDLVSVALNVDIVIEGRRQKVHWDTTVELAHHTLYDAAVLVEFSHFEDIMFLSAVLGQNQIVVAIHVKVHVVLADDLGVLLYLLP